ncbi:hypothetical protein EDB84DRAFT_1449082, partial [Lactarius hengduanensis]
MSSTGTLLHSLGWTVYGVSDAPSFDLCRSRIPTALLRDIVIDMDVLLFRYGTLRNHNTEETRSRLPCSCEYHSFTV